MLGVYASWSFITTVLFTGDGFMQAVLSIMILLFYQMLIFYYKPYCANYYNNLDLIMVGF